VGEALTRIVLQGNFPKLLKRQRAIWPNTEGVPEEMIRLRYEATRWQDIRKTYFKTLRAIINFRGMRRTVLHQIVQDLPSLQLPVLVVWGEQDDLVPSRHARIVENDVANARVEIFEDAGHDPMVVDPGRFNRVTIHFLRDTSR